MSHQPGVMLVSLLSFVAWMLLSTPLNALFAALSVAVIGYPCALGLSTPLALMRGTGLGVERGVLIRSGVAFQRLKDVDTVLFDKTGTLTPGRPVVTDVVAWEGEETALLELTASVEALSEHPLGAAIVQRAQAAGLGAHMPVEDLVALPGQGVRVSWRGPDTGGQAAVAGSPGGASDSGHGGTTRAPGGGRQNGGARGPGRSTGRPCRPAGRPQD